MSPNNNNTFVKRQNAVASEALAEQVKLAVNKSEKVSFESTLLPVGLLLPNFHVMLILTIAANHLKIILIDNSILAQL